MGCVAVFAGYAMPSFSESFDYSAYYYQDNEPEPPEPSGISNVISVRPLETLEYLDFEKGYPVDLQTPDNVRTEIEFDYETRTYILRTKIGDMEVGAPYVMSEEEYREYTLRQDMDNYWRARNAEAAQNYEDKFNITDMKFSLGPADKLFGPGGVQIRTQGSAEITFGIKHNNIQNYLLSERLRKTTMFDFDTKIQMSMNASVGEKIKFNMNYDTQSTFDFDRQNLKLAYEGKEDEWLRRIEAGNVSMNVNSALIPGSTSLFGIKTDMQFGKLKVSAVVSQQQSSSQNVNTNGGVRTIDFEVPADQYDANRHYFLAQFFRDNYDRNMSQLPFITSGITITDVEVWVTNKRGRFDHARNIAAFTDLGESDKVNSTIWGVTYSQPPANNTNNLYSAVKDNDGIRNINTFTQTMAGMYGNLIPSEDYEKIESARRLDPSEYTLNSALGFISLRQTLQADEVLAVAFRYQRNGENFQVGEFSTNVDNASDALIVKLLKGTAVANYSTLWDLMMKNVYSLGASSFQQENFKLNVLYRNDSTGTFLNYIPVGNIKDRTLLRVMNLDRLDVFNNPRPDGKFDYVEGYTIISSMGRVIFPVVEPFGSHLRREITGGDPSLNGLADRYVFQELYDSTLVAASEYSERNKFRISGSYQGTSNSEIYLNAMNVPRGSVTVTAGGITLVENVDYTIDYIMGVVTILNQSILSSNTPVDVRLESREMFNMQRKTLLGTSLEYAFSNDFVVGGTIMHLTEMPLVTKTMMGNEPIANTIWGLNASYRKSFQWLTTALDKLPLLEASAPSSITLNAEVAQMIPGHRKVRNNRGNAYLDDFETTRTSIDLRYPHYWTLASTPANTDNPLFPEATLSNDIDYGKNRALFAWFSIDNSVFNRERSSTMPNYLKNDKDARSNHLTRDISEREIFPNRDPMQGQEAYIPVLNVSFYPEERGPYNLDVLPSTYSSGIFPDGRLRNPRSRWGGMMRKIETSDFEQSNIEYLEFWLMDPFVNDTEGTHRGGNLYINLGDISEDILKDGKKFFENGMPIDGDTLLTERTVWGRVPTQQSTVLAFSSDRNSRIYQDVGFNGLRTEDERTFGVYANYILQLNNNGISSSFIDKVWNDPAGDNFHHYRGSDYDALELPILARYKYFNGTEGNSSEADNNGENFATSATSMPDVEDINQDNTLNEYERYFQYRIPLRHSDMQVGNFITDVREYEATLANGTKSTVKWYQYKIPVSEFEDRIGGIRDFKSIRFMRMFLTDFEEEIHLRFATLELVRGEWRTFTKDLSQTATPPAVQGTITVSSVNIEENGRVNMDGSQNTVNYVIPPGVTRETDPSQPQLRRQNEQSMVLRVHNLASGDARAVFKRMRFDLRRYKRMQMFAHIHRTPDDIVENLRDNDLSVFIRIGSDLVNNYYEYEIPLKVTPWGYYTPARAGEVWMRDNEFDFPLSVFTELKKQRNTARNNSESGVSLLTPYFMYDPEKPQNKVTIVGNPNIGDIETIMIGVRNANGIEPKSGEVWVNELRLTDFDQAGGWGALGNMVIALSDFANVNVSGRYESASFGGIEQSLLERRMDDYYQFNVATQVQMGRFFPEKAKVNIPVYYSYSIENSKPKYSPLDGDMLLSDALDSYEKQSDKDSILHLVQTRTITESFNVTGVKVDIRGKRPHFYDPANLSFSYAYNRMRMYDPETDRNTNINHQGSINYDFNTAPQTWEPFKNAKKLEKPVWKIIKDFGINYSPSRVALAVNVARIYSETQMRDLEGSIAELYRIEGRGDYRNDWENPLFSSAKNFNWGRTFNFNYELTKNLKFTFQSATNSRIEETMYSPVNRRFFPAEIYENWKDTVLQSLKNFGTPLTYQQVFSATYAVPINKIPIFDWITSTASYNTSYNWNLGAMTQDGTNLGNVISSVANWQIDGQFRFETLYNKSKYLKSVNQKYGGRSGSRNRFNPKTIERTAVIPESGSVDVRHGLNSTTMEVTTKNSKGKKVKVKFVAKDKNTITISGNANDSLALTITTTDPNLNKKITAKDVGAFTTRFFMMVRTASITYRESSGLTLAGFTGDAVFFGQSKMGGIVGPGLDFAFGMPGRDPDYKYIKKASERGWIASNVIGDDMVVNPSAVSFMSDLDMKANVEPFQGFKINLTARRMATDNTVIQNITSGNMQTVFSGNYQVTHIALGTSFWTKSVKLGNKRAYDLFSVYREAMAERIVEQYRDVRNPDGNFVSSNDVSARSGDAMIPAFLAAYSGRSIDKTKSDIVPSLRSMFPLPNWTVSFDGLINIPIIAKHFRSFVLNHSYQSSYNIGSYTSYTGFVPYEDGFGFIYDEWRERWTPSSGYDIASVSITENFAPFVGVDFALKNSFTGTARYNRQRNIALNITSLQIAEVYTNEMVFGIGYIIKDFDILVKTRGNQVKRVKNDLTMRLDFSLKDLSTLLRRIDTDEPPQATAGNKTFSVKFTADYIFSSKLNFRFFFDYQSNTPLITTSYPMAVTNAGLSIKFLLTR